MKEQITVLTITHDTKKCANQSHNPPSVYLMQTTLDSFRETFPELNGARHIVMYDYKGGDEYKENLRMFADKNKLELIIANNLGSRDIRCITAELIRSRYTFLLEHDWVWLSRPDLPGIMRAFDEDETINYIRFNKRANNRISIPMISQRMGGDVELLPVNKSKIDLLATSHFSDNPHISKTATLRDKWTNIVKNSPILKMGNGDGVYFEIPIQESSFDDYQKLGILEHSKQWGLYIYGSLGQEAIVKHIGE